MDVSPSHTKRDWVILSGEVDDNMAATLLTFLKDSKSKNVTIYINTYGGDTVQAIHMHNMLRRSKKKVTIHAFGVCMSAGTIIICGSDDRVATPDCTFMIHYGEEFSSSSSTTRFNQKIGREMRQIYKDNFNVRPSTIGKWMNAERIFKPGEPLKFGLVTDLKEVEHG